MEIQLRHIILEIIILGGPYSIYIFILEDHYNILLEITLFSQFENPTLGNFKNLSFLVENFKNFGSLWSPPCGIYIWSLPVVPTRLYHLREANQSA